MPICAIMMRGEPPEISRPEGFKSNDKDDTLKIGSAAHSALVFHSAGPRVEAAPVESAQDYDCDHLAGSFHSGRTVAISSFGDEPPRLSLADAKNGLGEWFGVFRNRHDETDYVVRPDSFAYQSVFYRIVPEGRGNRIFIAGSAQGLSSLLRQHHVTTGIDWVEAAAGLASSHNWAGTLNSVRTFGKDVFLLKPGEYIRINSRGVSVNSEAFFENDLNKSYSELLDIGISKSIDVLKYTSSLPLWQKRINLSGGKDSRIIMAMVTAAGLTQDYSITTMNPRKWAFPSARAGLTRDLLIADAMRRRYGMDWAPDDHQVRINLGFFDSLNYWQSHRSNRNYKFPAQKILYHPENLHVELRGAAGESFRYFWTYYLKKLKGYSSLKNTASSFHEDSDTVFDEIYPSSAMHPTVRVEARDRLYETLSRLGGHTFRDAADRHFSGFRNRGHFGHVNYSLTQNALPVLPLSQPEFVQAGQLLSVEDRESGAVFFDIIERLDPKLNDLRFDSAQWIPSIKARRSHDRGNTEWNVNESDSELHEFFSNDELNTVRRSTARSTKFADGRPFEDYEVREMCLNEAREVLYELRTIPEGSTYLPEAVVAKVLTQAETGVQSPQVLVSKLHSVRDMVEGSSPTVTRSYFIDPQAREQIALERTSVNVDETPGFRVHKNTISQRPTLEFMNDSAMARVSVSNPNGEDLEYAFYIYCNGIKIDHRWYTKEPYAEFALDQNIGEFTITSFVRYTHKPRLVLRRDSRKYQR